MAGGGGTAVLTGVALLYGVPVVSVEQLVAFGVAALILLVIPGPSVIFVIGRALAYGRNVALASVVGNSLGILIIVVTVAFGLGILVQESTVAFLVLRFAGAAYLVWLGVDAIRRRRDYEIVGTVPAGRPMTVGRSIRQGVVVGVTNPKGFMIFAAVLPQFVDRAVGHVQLQMLVLGLFAVAIGLVSDGLWAVLAARLRDWFTGSRGRGAAVGVAGGLSMIGLGVVLAVWGG